MVSVFALIVGFFGGRHIEKQRHEALGKGAEEQLEKARLEADAVRDRRLLEAERGELAFTLGDVLADA